MIGAVIGALAGAFAASQVAPNVFPGPDPRLLARANALPRSEGGAALVLHAPGETACDQGLEAVSTGLLEGVCVPAAVAAQYRRDSAVAGRKQTYIYAALIAAGLVIGLGYDRGRGIAP